MIVPAHDEATVIQRCLRGLCEGADPGELEVVVVCNGCSDDTAERARAVPGPIRVIESPVASKSEALNRGDVAANGFPRFYVDADVILPLASLRKVAEVLEAGRALAAAPRAEFSLDGSSRAVRAFYRVWTQLPYFDRSMIGAGVYGLSEVARQRFERFPDIIADDEFVRRHFASHERLRVDSCTFLIVAPTRLEGVLGIKTRSRLGRLELAKRYPHLSSDGSAGTRRTLSVLLRRPSLWPSAVVYTFVVLVTRSRARKRFVRQEFSSWDRDESSRATDDPC